MKDEIDKMKNENEKKIASKTNEIEQLKELNKQQEINRKISEENFEKQQEFMKKQFKDTFLKRIEKLEQSQKELESNQKSNQKQIQEIQEAEKKNSEKIDKHFNSQIIELIHQNGAEFNGINNYLINQTGGNIHDNCTVVITTNSSNGDYAHPKCLVDYQNQNNYYHSQNDTDIEVCFDFKNKKVNLTGYSIKSIWNGINSCNLKNWVVEVSNDKSQWEIVDEPNNDSTLNGASLVAYFSTKKTIDFYRYVRLRQTGRNWENDYLVIIVALEFYGKLQIP